MFEWIFGNRYKQLEEKTQSGFSSVKKDMEVAGKWIKHLDGQDKQLFDAIKSLKQDLTTVKQVIAELREDMNLSQETGKGKQVFGKREFLSKQTGVWDDEKSVQTAVQTGSFHSILKELTANERLLVFTLMNSDMKLSYEDLALLLGKERSTVRGQINAIKQKSEDIIEELTERNGKKRVFVPEEIRQKLQKYAKVRVGKSRKNEEKAKEV